MRRQFRHIDNGYGSVWELDGNILYCFTDIIKPKQLFNTYIVSSVEKIGPLRYRFNFDNKNFVTDYNVIEIFQDPVIEGAF